MANEGNSLPFLTRRSLLLGAAASLAPAAGVAQPLIIRPEIKGVDPRYAAYALVGPYPLPKSPIMLRTPRSRIIVFHPVGRDTARTVVFSHGALSDPLTYRNLLQHWATHGFAVACPVHEDAAIEDGLKLRSPKVDGLSEWQIPKLLEDEKAWRSRADACSACLDAMPLISQATGIRLLDERPVIVGHGLCAFAAQLLIGAKVRSSKGSVIDLRDPRFFSGILMSPQGAGVMGLEKESWKDIANPLLTVLASGDRDFTDQSPERKADPYRLSRQGYKHLALLDGAVSTSFAGQSAESLPAERKIFEVLKALTTAFLLAYSSYDEAAFADMGTDFFRRMSLGMVKEERR